MRRKVEKIYSYAVIVLVITFFAAVIFSWINSMITPETSLRTVLSNEGLRNLFGKLPFKLVNTPLLWLVLSSFAVGITVESKIISGIKQVFKQRNAPYKVRFALKIVAFQILVYLIIACLLILLPNAVLLNVEGEIGLKEILYTFVPTTALAITLCSITYSLLLGTIKSVSKIIISFGKGLQLFAPLFIIYILFLTNLYTIIYILAL